MMFGACGMEHGVHGVRCNSPIELANRPLIDNLPLLHQYHIVKQQKYFGLGLVYGAHNGALTPNGEDLQALGDRVCRAAVQPTSGLVQEE